VHRSLVTRCETIFVQIDHGGNFMTLQPIGLTFPLQRRVSEHHTLDELDARIGKRTVIFTSTGDAVGDVLASAGRHIRGLANAAAVQHVLSHNPDSFWGIASREKFDAATPRAEGFVAFLMLNPAGLRALGDGSLNRADPQLDYLVRQNERPAGIYCWAIFAPAFLIAAVPLVYEQLCIPRYRGVSLYGWAATEDGKRICQTLGFTLGAPLHGEFAPHLYYYPRGDARSDDNPIFDQYQPTSDPRRLSVTVARTFEDIMKVVSIRSAVYIAEQDCPFDEEFDGNDFSATHLIGYVGNEPAGCLRIRYFGTFAKIERLAVRHEFRKTKLAFRLARAGVEFCKAKGYRCLYGHSRKDLVNFWRRFGFEPIADRPEFAFSDVAYVEIAQNIEPYERAVVIGDDPYRVIRPEGRWQAPGILEKSATRGVHVKR
jgi:predicted GNAT family N-acyltransferase